MIYQELNWGVPDKEQKRFDFEMQPNKTQSATSLIGPKQGFYCSPLSNAWFGKDEFIQIF